MNERNNDALSITFPSTCWMKTKRGSYDFAFNLQEIMTENQKKKEKIHPKKILKELKTDIFVPQDVL